MVVVVWCGGFFTDYKTTPTKVVLSCFGLLVGLWQYDDILVCEFSSFRMIKYQKVNMEASAVINNNKIHGLYMMTFNFVNIRAKYT